MTSPGTPRRPLRILSISAYPFWDDEDRKGMPSIYLEHKALRDAGHEVLYLYPQRETREFDYDGIRMRTFRLRFALPDPGKVWRTRFAVKIYYPIFLMRASWEALRVARRFKPDIVYGQLYQAVPVAWLVSRVQRIPNITRMYGTFLAPWVRSWKRFLRYEEVLAYKVPCSAFIMTNDGTRGDECADVLGVPPSRFKFWRNGVDKSMYDPSFDREAFKAAHGIPADHVVVLALGRLERWKGVDRLIAALPAVLARRPDVTVLVVGDGAERQRLEQQARDLGVAHAVRFLGAILHAGIRTYLNGADIFVSLYHYSNVGNPLLEALACAKCIVTIDNGATGKLIRDGETGLLVHEQALEHLPGALLRVIDDPALRARLSSGARADAEANLQTWPERLEMEVHLVQELATGADRSERTVQHGTV